MKRRLCKLCREHGGPRTGCYTCDPEILRKRMADAAAATGNRRAAFRGYSDWDGNSSTDGWEYRSGGN